MLVTIEISELKGKVALLDMRAKLLYAGTGQVNLVSPGHSGVSALPHHMLTHSGDFIVNAL